MENTDEINTDLIRKYKIELKKDNLKNEIYKWNLLGQYKGHPDPNAPDFSQEIKSTKFKNLIYQIASAVSLHLATERPEQYRVCFRGLFDESVPLPDRIVNFSNAVLKLYRELDSQHPHHHDERTIAAFLTFHNPEKYAFFKNTFYRKYCRLLGIEMRSKGDKYVHYLELLNNFIEKYIKKDQELISKVNNILPSNAYKDPTLTLLAQDILYTVLDKGQEEIDIGSARVFKVSMGSLSEKEIEECLEESSIVVHGKTRSIGTTLESQGESFEHTMQVGDYFYLTHGNKPKGMKLLGKAISDATPSDREFNNGSGWLQRKFEVLATSVNQSPYEGRQKWWTPNHNSTIVQIKRNELEEANKLIFEPYFHTRLISSEEEDSTTLNEELQMTLPLNQILYGPPGTGKTYSTINQALLILEGESADSLEGERSDLKKSFDQYVKEGRIVFTTFHQSMSYEDFVEGIKPSLNEDQNVIYDIEEGLFKRIASAARDNWLDTRKGIKEQLSFEEAFDKLKDEWHENPNLKFPLKREGNEFTIMGFTKSSISFRKASGGTGHTLSISTLRDFFYDQRELKSTGLGIYYPAIKQKLKSYQPILIVEKKEKSFVLIIDEINRGNVSQIFGELITLLEDDKRLGRKEALEVTLTYSKDRFGVPPNLHIIGTMNTADRSVESLDTALRRRFSFVEMTPRYDLKELNTEVLGYTPSAILQTINTRLEKLLDKDHLIGHSYFIDVDGDAHHLRRVFQNKIIPLLQEYFYGDPGKIGLVLGSGFVEFQEINESVFAKFPSYDSADLVHREVYRLTNMTTMSDAQFEQAIVTLMD